MAFDLSKEFRVNSSRGPNLSEVQRYIPNLSFLATMTPTFRHHASGILTDGIVQLK